MGDDSVKYPIKISNVINDEQMLDFALSHITEKDSCEVHPVADQIVIVYIMNEMVKNGKETFSECDIQDKYQEYLTDYIITKLARDGLVGVRFDDDGETLYSLTTKGRNKING